MGPFVRYRATRRKLKQPDMLIGMNGIVPSRRNPICFLMGKSLICLSNVLIGVLVFTPINR